MASLSGVADEFGRPLGRRVICTLGQRDRLQNGKLSVVVHGEAARPGHVADYVDEPGSLHEDRVARQNLGIVFRLRSGARGHRHTLRLVGMATMRDDNGRSRQRGDSFR